MQVTWFSTLSAVIILIGPRIPCTSPESTPCSNCDGNNVTCVDGVCSPRCVSVTSSGECLQCRDSRFYGKQCEDDCPDTCLNSRCQMDNTRVVCTEGCVAGKKGDNCGVNCPTACTQCERYGDGCTGPCQNPQYYGPHCRTPCSSSCTDGCNRITGECGSCEPGYMGDKCDVTCPPNCRDGCDKDTGECDSCEPGYTGDKCDVTCPPNCSDGCDKDTEECYSCVTGYTGDKCDVTCPPNCRGGCDKDTGECDSCEPGYTGDKCDVTCPPNCRGGCDKDTGDCDSCEPGYTGNKCNVTCPLNCRDEDCGNCTPSTTRANAEAACVVLVAIPILILVVIVYRRRRKGRQQNQKGTPNPTYTSCSVYTLGGDMCDELSGDTSKEVMEGEFKKLPSYIKPVNCATLDENEGKNRYKDILPFDATRVPLEIENEDDSDYINASYIDGYMDQTRYVATQGPLEHTKNDFWRMIWQLNTAKIVMVTNLMESGKLKCYMYWPFCSSESTMYGSISVQCAKEEVYETYTLRSMAIWKEATETRMIKQFHFTQWPDHGVPSDTTALLHFNKVVKDTALPLSGPLVVHCSAGVGRTGTFLALDYLLDQARSEGRVCVYNCVQHFRRERMKMVQTKEQYIFIHSILLDALQCEQTLTRPIEPVHIQCETCWNQINNKHRVNMDISSIDSDEEDVLYENVPHHWARQLQQRSGDAASLPDVCDVVCETMPLLSSATNTSSEERSPEEKTDDEGGRMSWVSPLLGTSDRIQETGYE
ncbi:tyrosine-protein phosphatase 10D-like [Haliotis rufescens]|uniref:tyrosine-protein phosphatase 10D-like n=1 Tax=Haliotis rufescens TaxID=6454 RepID=UPI00201EF1A2|nr:tyrosine-protein phosphatase 10D-like [Haliotis rufescens]